MADMDDVRDELFAAASRIIGRQPTAREQQAIIESYNGRSDSSIFLRGVGSLEDVYDIDLEVRVLLEKSASVDRVRHALANLRAIAATSGKRR